MKKVILILAIFAGIVMFASCAKKGAVLTLNNTKWVLSQWADRELPTTAKATLSFSEVGRVNGKSFCNSYGGDVKISGSNITFGNMFSTKMFCQDLAEMEDIYLADLAKVTRGNIIDGKLHLYQADKLLMVFSSVK